MYRIYRAWGTPSTVDSPFPPWGTEAMENSRPGPAVSGVVVTATHSAVRTP